MMQRRALFNPFPGLRPFEPDEDHLFFGREKEIDELLRRLRSGRFLSVVGTSGSGKSSLVRSGLIPSLYSGFMVGAGSGWRVSILRPGEDPIGHLAASLNAPDVLGGEGELASTNRVLLDATIRRGTLGLVEAVRLARIPPHDNLLLVVDQFEELFRYRRSRQTDNSRDEAAVFVKLLLEAAQQDSVPIYVVLTMRSDFIGDCMEFQGLPEAINAGLYLVPRMTRDELRSAITGPVAVGGGQIAPRLVQRLLNDVGDDPDQLPVLQHALMRTWDQWERHQKPSEAIDIVDYEAVGTMRQALSLHAEEAYQETGSEGSRQIAERIFKALTDTSSDYRGVRRPTSLRELAAIGDTPEPEAIQIIEIFRRPGRSFLMPPATVSLDSRSIIDLSHESLMRCWTRLITWAEEERVSAGHYLRLSQAATWFEEGTAGLWRDPELEFGLQWKRQNRPTAAWAQRYDPSFARAMDFLERSEKERDRLVAEEERERKRKLKQTQWAAAILAILLVIAAGSFLVAWRENALAEANLRQAKDAVDEMLSSAGRQSAREEADLPQMEEFRRELLDKAKGFYLGFTKEQPGNEELRNEMARAHLRLGDINRLLENPGEAVKEYQEAITQFQRLADHYPRKPEYRQELAYCYNWLGETLRPLAGRGPDAEEAYERALHLQQDLVRENPENAAYRQELARTHYNRGILRYARDDAEASESDFRTAIGLLEPLAKTTESSADAKAAPDAAQDLARAYNNLANVLTTRTNHKEEAGKLYEQAIGLAEELSRKQPDNREYKLEWAIYCNNQAWLLEGENELDLAKQRNHQALDIIEDLANPGYSLSIELVKALQLRTEILEAQGSPELQPESDRLFQTLKRLRNTQTLREHSAFPAFYRDLAINYVKLAEKNLNSGALREAQADLRRLADVFPELSDQDKETLTGPYQELQKELNEDLVRHRRSGNQLERSKQ